MRKMKFAAAALFVLLAAWVFPPVVSKLRRLCPVRPGGVREAGALPAFSRKYGVSCSQCHYAYPILNGYGRQFKMNGFVREKGSSDGVLKTPDNQLWIEKIFPWALIVRSRPIDNGKGSVANQGTQMGGTASPNPNGFKFEPLNDADFFVAGGDAAKQISYFGEIDANSAGDFSPALGDLRFGWHPYQFANVILARRGFFADDPYQTIASNESPTIANKATDLLMSDQGSISGNAITGSQQMAAINGQVNLPGSQAFLYYALGATKDSDLGHQARNPTNGAMRLAFDSGGGMMVGGFGAYGHEGPFADCGAGGACPGLGFTDNTAKEQFLRGGFDGLLEMGALAFRAAFVYLHDGDPAFDGASATDRAAYAELAYAFTLAGQDYPFLLPLIRENWYTTFNGAQQFNYITAHLAHYFRPNVKAFVEYSVDTKRAFQGGTLPAQGSDGALAMRGNRATVQVEVGF